MTTSVGRTSRGPGIVQAGAAGTRDGALADGITTLLRTARSARVAFVEWTRRVRSLVTVFGRSLALVAVLAFVCGYVFGWAEAVVVAWASVVMFAVAMFYLVGRTSYGVQLVVPVHRVVAGERAPAEVIAENRASRRVAGARIEVSVGSGVAEFVMPSLPRNGRFQDVFLVPTKRRGVIPLGPARTVRADPIGLLRRDVEWGTTHELFVHPRTIAIPSVSTGLIRDLEGRPSRDLTASDVAFHALREYLPGDEPRNIHWKSTAKAGSYMVRQFEQTRRSHLMVALSLADADYANEEEFELAVSVTGSLGVSAIRDSRTVSMVASAVMPEFARRRVYSVTTLSSLSPVLLLDDLARVESSPRATSVGELARIALDQVSGMSIAFLICGTMVSISQLRRAQAAFPVDVEVVAVICDPEAPPVLRSIAGLTMLHLGFLEDLQKSLARSRAS